MRRKILSLAAALALCLSLCPAWAFAAEGDTGGDTPSPTGPWDCGTAGNESAVTATLENGVLTISGSGPMMDYKTPPETPTAPWHEDSIRLTIQSIVIEENVTSIGTNAFEGCSALETVTFTGENITIGGNAFDGCTSLKTVNVPYGVETGYTWPEGVTVNVTGEPDGSAERPWPCGDGVTATLSDDGVLTISLTGTGTGAMADYAADPPAPWNAAKASISKVVITDGVTSIGASAFDGCTSLTQVEIPASVTSIGTGAFTGSTNAAIYFAGTEDAWNSIGTDIGITDTNRILFNSHQVYVDDVSIGFYSTGAEVTVSAGTPAEGKIFDKWTAVGLSLSDEDAGKPDLTFPMPGNDVKLTPSWKDFTLNLDGSDDDDKGHWETLGYRWENVVTDEDSGEITSATLTLAPGFNAKEVTIPGAAVTIVATGACQIGKLGIPGSGVSETVNLVFDGAGPLTIHEQLNIASGNYNTLTVNQRANVIANGGIYFGTASGVDGVMTVNGTLTAKSVEDNGFDVPAIITGKVAVGGSGILNVSGVGIGLSLMGMDTGGLSNFNDAFTLKPGGRLTVDCGGNAISVTQNAGNTLGDDLKEDEAIVVPSGYLPQNRQPQFNDGRTELFIEGGKFTISADNVPQPPRPPIPSHTHRWAEDWTTSETHHWHECTASGCRITENSRKDGYGEHIYNENGECTVCGHIPAHTHQWAEDWTTSETHHWHECTAPWCRVTEDSQKDGYGEHVYDENGECTVCGHVPVHTHQWAEDWTTSETHHWHECTAPWCRVTENSQKDGYGEHVYDNSQDAVCNVCGYRRTVTPPTPPGPSRPSQSSGGGSSSSSYRVTVEQAAHGKVSSNRTSAESGSTVTLTVTPDSGYALDTLTVTDSRGDKLNLTPQSGGKYTFTMPSRAVTVKAAFAALPEDVEHSCDGGTACPSRGFTDLGPVGIWYHEAVDYVLQNGLMNGYSSTLFGPDDNLSRAQFVQILYNRADKPAVTGSSVFADVPDGKWYTPAITWAAANGVAGGYDNGMFGPDDNITREQLVVMLWRYAGSPAAGDKALQFTDADKASGSALEALRWASENGILNGYSDGRFNPGGPATRVQAAQMLKNFYNSKI